MLTLAVVVGAGACGSDANDSVVVTTTSTTTSTSTPTATDLDRDAIARDVAAKFSVSIEAANCGVAALDDVVLGRWVDAELDFNALDAADAQVVYTAATTCGLTPG